MSGRGRGATLPAWMTQGSVESDVQIHTVAAPVIENSTRYEFNDSQKVVGDRPSRENRSASRDGRERRQRSPDRRNRSRSPDRRDRDRDRDRGSGRDRSPDKEWKPRKRLSNFDVPPENGIEKPGVGSAVPDTNDPNVHSILERYLGPSVVKNDMTSVNMQQTKHARRLYVGGIAPDTSEDELGSFFADTINKSISCSWDDNRNSVLNVYINREKCFAFVEVKSIELATACVGFDGIAFVTRAGARSTLRIRRPNDFKPELLPPNLRPTPTINMSALGLVSSNVTDGPGKVFVGGLPYHLMEDQVKELLTVFGPLKSFHLVRDPGMATSKGYGFCEYNDSITTQTAIAGLNGLAVGDKTLTVRLAAQNNTANPPQTMVAPATLVYNAPNTSYNSYAYPNAPVSAPMKYGALPINASLNHSNLAMTPPTRILKLGNMVTPYDLEFDQEYYDILEDVKIECSPYGEVLQVLIPRAKDGYPPQSEGNIFVEFSRPDMARTAAASLIGRKFAERTVVVEYFDEALYHNRRL